MPRLSEAEARRLADALGKPGEVLASPDAQAGRSAPRSDTAADDLRRLLADTAALDELGRTLTLDLATYLNRPVRCSVTRSAAAIADAWRFEASMGEFVLWLDLDVRLAAAFADAMIGGDGSGSVGRGRRIRGLAEPAALRMMRAIAACAGVEPPGAVVSTSATPDDPALAGGLCAVAADQHAWLTGVRAAAPAALTPPLLRPSAPHASLVRVEPDAVVARAIDALRDRLQEVLRCGIAMSDRSIARLEGTELKPMTAAALGLALTAGGKGAVVAFLNADAVVGIAGAAVGATLPPADPNGDVIIAAAEAIVRDALGVVAGALPGIAGDAHRVVRLSDDPLPARTPHHAAEIRMTIGGRTGLLQLLVPSWMLESESAPRA
jgi:hypothetical protein